MARLASTVTLRDVPTRVLLILSAVVALLILGASVVWFFRLI